MSFHAKEPGKVYFLLLCLDPFLWHTDFLAHAQQLEQTS
jgi:hypothetical protein